MRTFKILTINPGATSTKFAVFEDESTIFEEVIRHSSSELEGFKSVPQQYEYRKHLILNKLSDRGFDLSSLSAIVGRGGLLRPIPAGVYRVSKSMVQDLEIQKFGEHASNLGALIAYDLSMELSLPAFVVDPVSVDELDQLARVSGHPSVPRRSAFHALNQKAVAQKACSDFRMEYNSSNLIVAHMGSGISVGAHRDGRVVDVNDALNGDGPFSPERSGGIPVGGLIELCFSKDYTLEEMMDSIHYRSGLRGYLGTNDAREVVKRIEAGDEYAKTIYQALSYQIAKEIASLSAVFNGNVDLIILTGGLAYDGMLSNWISKRVNFLSRVLVYAGEDEMLSMAKNVLSVLKRDRLAVDYV